MRSLFISLLLVFSLNTLFAQSKLTKSEEVILRTRGELYFSFKISQRMSVQNISNIISVDKVDDNSRVYAYANENNFIKFLNLGIDYRLEKESYLKISPQMAISMAAFMQTWSSYPTYEQYDSLMHKLANDYPNLCRYHELGTLASGRKIMVLQIGAGVNIPQKKVRFLYTSSMHGNELSGYVLLLRLANYLLSQYGQNAQVDSLLNNVELWINPLANPDGAYQAGNSTLSGATRYNANFIDLNRNYPDPDDGPHPDGEVWQAETQYFMSLADSVHFSMSANFHGGAEVFNYPWDTWSKLPADYLWWKWIGKQYADTAQSNSPANYFLGPAAAMGSGVVNGFQWYPIFGSRQDYMNYYQHCREVTIELSAVKTPQSSYLPNLWNYNYKSMLNYAEQARYGLRGVVTDSVSGKPIEAMITINSFDKDSSQVFSHLPFGDYYRLLDSGYYSISYSAPHYNTKTQDSVLIIRNQITKLDMALVPDYSGISQNQAFSFELYPNPASNYVYISAKKPFSQVELYSLTGFLIQEYHIAESKTTKLRFDGLAPGVYLIRITDDVQLYSCQKLIIR